MLKMMFNLTIWQKSNMSTKYYFLNTRIYLNTMFEYIKLQVFKAADYVHVIENDSGLVVC